MLGKLNSLLCTLLLHAIGKENKNYEKGHLTIMLKPHGSWSQKSGHVDKSSTKSLSFLHRRPEVSTTLAEIFQSPTFFLFFLTISSFTSPESYFLLICPFGAEWTMQRLSAAKLFLCRQRLQRCS